MSRVPGVEVLFDGNRAVINVEGDINEGKNLSLLSLAGATFLLVDFKRVKSINSNGIRRWILWLGTVPEAQVEYHNCPRVIVDQINLVDGFLPKNGKVKSFYVPYYNETSGDEQMVLFTYGQEFSESHFNPPIGIVDSYGKMMSMDVIETRYFKFLKLDKK